MIYFTISVYICFDLCVYLWVCVFLCLYVCSITFCVYVYMCMSVENVLVVDFLLLCLVCCVTGQLRSAGPCLALCSAQVSGSYFVMCVFVGYV